MRLRGSVSPQPEASHCDGAAASGPPRVSRSLVYSGRLVTLTPADQKLWNVPLPLTAMPSRMRSPSKFHARYAQV
jgi:hypothetical protein